MQSHSALTERKSMEEVWDNYYSGDPRNTLAQSNSTPNYDAVYPNPLRRHVEIMYNMGIKSLDATVKRGNKKAYFFEDGCGSGRYRIVAQKLADYAKRKGYNIHIIWIGNDISQRGLDLFKKKLEEEGFKDGYGYNPFPLEPKQVAVTKDNLTFKFMKSSEHTSMQDLAKNIGVIVENAFSIFGIDGYRDTRLLRRDMMRMRGILARNDTFFTVPGPAYKMAIRHYDKTSPKTSTCLTNSPNTIAILHSGDITYKRGNLTIPFHTFTEEELTEDLKAADLEGTIFISNTRHEKDGLVSSKDIEEEDERLTEEANKLTDPFLRALNAVYLGVIAKSTLAKDPRTGRLLSKTNEPALGSSLLSKL